MQVASRLLLVWAIVNTFPLATSRSPAYASMLTAWSATEVIRYSFFAINLSTSQVPDTLKWLRYNTFFVLYPLGISSECWLVYSSIVPAERWHPVFGWALKAVLLIYIPGESDFSLMAMYMSMYGTLTGRVSRVIHLVHAYDGSETQGHEGQER